MLGIDIETTSLDPAEGEISLMQLYDPEHKRVVILDGINGSLPRPQRQYKRAFNGDGGMRWVELPNLENVVEVKLDGVAGVTILSSELHGIAHNATFEERWLKEKLDFDARLHDTMSALLVLYTGTNAAHNKQFSHSLAAVAMRELKRELPKDEQDSDWSARPLTRSQLEYAARDAAVLPPLFDTLMHKINAAGLREVYDLELRVARAVDQMQRNGFAIHEGRLASFIEGTGEEARQLKSELEDEWDINPGSSKQLREYFGLDRREGWPTTAAGAPKTDQDAMRLLTGEEPAIAKWLQWKKVEQFRSTYGESLRKKIVNGRIHGRFKQFGTATGRFSSAEPNLQNIPKDAAVRGMFWSGSAERVLVKADYSGIELWLAAVLWGEKRMQKLLAEGTNLHTATASSIYGIPREEISKESLERHVGKTASFALLYGAGPNRLRTQLAFDGARISEQESYDIFRKFLDTYPAFNRRRYEIRMGFEEGRIKEARTRIGRRRNDSVDWYGPLMNHEIQGTGADGLKFAMARIHETNPFRSAKMVCARSTRRDRVRVRCEGG